MDGIGHAKREVSGGSRDSGRGRRDSVSVSKKDDHGMFGIRWVDVAAHPTRATAIEEDRMAGMLLKQKEKETATTKGALLEFTNGPDGRYYFENKSGCGRLWLAR